MEKLIALQHQFSEEIWNVTSTTLNKIVEGIEQELENRIQEYFYSNEKNHISVAECFVAMEAISNSFFTIYRSIGPQDTDLLVNKRKCHYLALQWIHFWKHVLSNPNWALQIKSTVHLQLLLEAFFDTEQIHPIYFEQENYLEAFSELVLYLQLCSHVQEDDTSASSTTYSFQSLIVSFEDAQVVRVIDLLFLRQSKDQTLIERCLGLLTNLLYYFASVRKTIINCLENQQDEPIIVFLTNLFEEYLEQNETIAEYCLTCLDCCCQESQPLLQIATSSSKLKQLLLSIKTHPMEYSQDIYEKSSALWHSLWVN